MNDQLVFENCSSFLGTRELQIKTALEVCLLQRKDYHKQMTVNTDEEAKKENLLYIISSDVN